MSDDFDTTMDSTTTKSTHPKDTNYDIGPYEERESAYDIGTSRQSTMFPVDFSMATTTIGTRSKSKAKNTHPKDTNYDTGSYEERESAYDIGTARESTMFPVDFAMPSSGSSTKTHREQESAYDMGTARESTMFPVDFSMASAW